MKVRFSFILDIEDACDHELQQCIDAAEEVAAELGCTMDEDDRSSRCCVEQVNEEATK